MTDTTLPLGAYALATRMLFVQTGIAALRVFFWLLLANLVVFWLITAYRTARFVFERLHAEQAAGVTQKGAGSAH